LHSRDWMVNSNPVCEFHKQENKNSLQSYRLGVRGWYNYDTVGELSRNG
jgi:hypothetical protein